VSEQSQPEPLRPSRRGLLTGAIGGALGLAVGAGATAALTQPRGVTAPSGAPEPVAAAGGHQAGIHRPFTPQRFGALVIADVRAIESGWLGPLGERILELTSSLEAFDVLPDGPGDLTVTVGLGPDLVRGYGAGEFVLDELPLFRGDEAIDPAFVGGDLLLSAYSSDPTVLAAVLDDLLRLVPGADVRWRQFVFRGQGSGTKARNPLGFMDGIVVPKTAAELAESVWIPDGPVAGGTVAVVRRLRLDTSAFRALEVGDREAVIGRRLADGAPLSGGKPDDQVDLRAKTPEGEFLIPADAHARAAHPSFTGSSLMLRRSYSFENDGGTGADSGLVFMSFQNEQHTFTATQQRLDEVDALMAFTTPTASAVFLILPGFDAERPLGSTLGQAE